MLANTPVAAGAERQVRRARALADQTVAVINLFLLFAGVADDGGCVGGVVFPAVRVPLLRVGEEGRVSGAHTRSGEKSVRRRNDIFGAGDRHRLLDGAEDRVDRGVKAQCLLDDGVV